MPPSVLSAKRHAARTLVVDKEPAIRSTANLALVELGFTVVEIDDGLRALSLLRTDPCFDLLVTESDPSGIDGKTLAESFMLACRFGRVVMLSAVDDIDSVNLESTGGFSFRKSVCLKCSLTL